MAGGGNDREQNYWPGFVDALSNVVLTLVFVLVVFVFALSMLAAQASKAMEEMQEQRQNQQREKMTQAQQVVGSSESTALVEQAKAVEVESKEVQKQQVNRGATKLQTTSNEITIIYPLSVLELDEASMNELKAALETRRTSLLNASHVRIESHLGSEPYSLAQRLAYYRAIRVRNMLIDGQFAAPNKISSKLVESVKDQGRVRIIYTQ